MSQAHNTTDLLLQMDNGAHEAVDWLFQNVYDDLIRLARHKLKFERRNHTLNTQDLVHEAYLRLVDQTRVSWRNRAQFLAVASQAMHRILINYAKQRSAQKRNSGEKPISVKEEMLPADIPDGAATDLLFLNEAMEALRQFNPRGYMVVECRFFGGMTFDEIAHVSGYSSKTIRRSWDATRAWLKNSLTDLHPNLTESTLLSGMGDANL